MNNQGLTFSYKHSILKQLSNPAIHGEYSVLRITTVAGFRGPHRSCRCRRRRRFDISMSSRILEMNNAYSPVKLLEM